MDEFQHTYAAALDSGDVILNRRGLFRRTANVCNTTVTPQFLMNHVRQIMRIIPTIQNLSISGGLLLYTNGIGKFYYPSNNSQLFTSPFHISLNKKILKKIEEIISQFNENDYCDKMSAKNCLDSEPGLSLLTVVQFTAYFSPKK